MSHLQSVALTYAFGPKHIAILRMLALNGSMSFEGGTHMAKKKPKKGKGC